MLRSALVARRHAVLVVPFVSIVVEKVLEGEREMERGRGEKRRERERTRKSERERESSHTPQPTPRPVRGSSPSHDAARTLSCAKARVNRPGGALDTLAALSLCAHAAHYLITQGMRPAPSPKRMPHVAHSRIRPTPLSHCSPLSPPYHIAPLSSGAQTLTPTSATSASLCAVCICLCMPCVYDYLYRVYMIMCALCA